MASVRDSISHLFSLGRFDDVRVDATLADAGRVALRYELSPIHPVTRIQFTGPLSVPGIDIGQLRRAVVDRYGTSPPLGRVEELKQLVSDAACRTRLSSPRHPAARRDRPRAGSGDACSSRSIRVRVPRSGRIDVDGTPSVPPAELLARLDLAPGAPYRRDELNTRIERYLADRHKAEYYEAKLTVTPILVDDDRTVNLVLTVDSGTARPRGLQGRSAAGREARRAGAGRARRLGRRRSAGGFDQPDRDRRSAPTATAMRRRRTRGPNPAVSCSSPST